MVNGLRLAGKKLLYLLIIMLGRTDMGKSKTFLDIFNSPSDYGVALKRYLAECGISVNRLSPGVFMPPDRNPDSLQPKYRKEMTPPKFDRSYPIRYSSSL